MTNNLFIEAARTGRNDPWRYGITVLLAVLLIFGSTTCLTLAAIIMTGSVNVQAVLNLPPALFLIVNLVPFAFIIAALWAGMAALHRRPFFSLINPRTWTFDRKRFFLSAGLWLAISALGDGFLSLIQPGNYVFHFDPAQFLPYLIAAVILIPIQSSAEELLFRGYLTQGLGLAGGFWLALLAPAVLFGLLHGANPEVGAFGMLWTLPVYISLGLLLGWITLRSESLELALGLHISNNLYSALLVTYPSSALKSPALFSIQTYNAPLAMVVGLAGMLLYLLLLYLIGRGFFRKGLFGVLALLVILVTACAPASTSAPAAVPTIDLQDCRLSLPGSGQINAHCGKLKVYEDPQAKSGKQITLNIAVVRAVSRTPAPDPIFLLAGGPGQAATEAFPPLLFSIERLRFKRDLIMVDQRGTGQSNPLHCPQIEDPSADQVTGVEQPLETELTELKTCRQALNIDPHLYTTEIAVQDLDLVRQSLGYDVINLLGVSYGTRAALTYQRLFPEHTRSLILDGVVPPNWALGSEVHTDAQRALELVIQRCQAEAGCKAQYPALEQEFRGLISAVEKQPVEITIAHPTSGKPVRVQMNPVSIGTAVRLMSYSDLLAALLPLAVHSAAQGDYHLLASEYLMLASDLGEGINIGMYYSVVCSEDEPLLPAQLPRGNAFLDPQVVRIHAACDAWLPVRTAPAPVTVSGDTPTLLISGSADPVTPPENGDAVVKLLPNSRHLVLPGLGHNNFYAGCVPNLLYDFLETARPKDLDITCLQTIKAQPFFVSPAGPEP